MEDCRRGLSIRVVYRSADDDEAGRRSGRRSARGARGDFQRRLCADRNDVVLDDKQRAVMYLHFSIALMVFFGFVSAANAQADPRTEGVKRFVDRYFRSW